MDERLQISQKKLRRMVDSFYYNLGSNFLNNLISSPNAPNDRQYICQSTNQSNQIFSDNKKCDTIIPTKNITKQEFVYMKSDPTRKVIR